MFRMRKTISTLMLALLPATWTPGASAQPSETPPAQSDRQHDAPYLTGGVGEEERAQILAQAQDFDLKLVFAAEGGAYLADVQVIVLDAKGHVQLDVSAAGPILLARLPAGSYRVRATAEGRSQQHNVSLSGKRLAELTLRW